jgi:hypothetical protein
MSLLPLNPTEVEALQKELAKHGQMLGLKNLRETEEPGKHHFFDFEDNDEYLYFPVDSHFMNSGKPLGLVYLDSEDHICQALTKNHNYKYLVEHEEGKPPLVFETIPEAVKSYLQL